MHPRMLSTNNPTFGCETMSWNELSEALSFGKKKTKGVVVTNPCERCHYWQLRKGIDCKPCRKLRDEE